VASPNLAGLVRAACCCSAVAPGLFMQKPGCLQAFHLFQQGSHLLLSALHTLTTHTTMAILIIIVVV